MKQRGAAGRRDRGTIGVVGEVCSARRTKHFLPKKLQNVWFLHPHFTSQELHQLQATTTMDGNGARRSPPDRARALPAEAGEPASDKVPILAADALAGRDAEREPDAVFFPSMLKDARGAARSHVSGSNRALVNQPIVRETDGWAHAGADDEPLSAAQWLQHKVGAWRIWKLDPTLSQRQMGGLAAVSVLGLIGFMFGGQPDTRNDFSCAAWENVITKFQNSRQFEDATLIVGHATRCGICVALVLRQRWCQCVPVRASARVLRT